MHVVYDPRQSVAGVPARLTPGGLSPSAAKPALVVEAWKNAGIPLEFISPRPLTVEELALAHERAYIEGVLAGTRNNGFGNTMPQVAVTLPWTSGSFATAALRAIATGQPQASPTSGFHHACYRVGGGFCTFNGLVIAAQLVRKAFPKDKVGILDCDFHYGNGTDDIIRVLGLDWIQHWTFGKEDIAPWNVRDWLQKLPELVASFKNCRVLLYQAGADPHIDDPLGGLLTDAQLEERDRLVFQTCKALSLPVAWNLAGGYQDPIERVLEIHTRTAWASIQG
jgi:acetoin utilization deacetylase AcuC-like enzyme